MWYETFDSAFWLTLSGGFFGVIVAVLNAVLKSRCKRCNFLCFSCERNFEDDDIMGDPKEIKIDT